MAVIPFIFPDDKLVSNFEIKFEIFSSQFAVQCIPVKNAIILPKFKYRTDKRLNS